MLNELRDTVPLVMKCEGVDVEQRDRSRLAESDRKTEGRRRIGAIRVHRQRLLHRPTNGNVVAAIGWSGDAVQFRPTTRTSDGRRPKKAASSGRTTW